MNPIENFNQATKQVMFMQKLMRAIIEVTYLVKIENQVELTNIAEEMVQYLHK